jgi:hypothetical protein
MYKEEYMTSRDETEKPLVEQILTLMFDELQRSEDFDSDLIEKLVNLSKEKKIHLDEQIKMIMTPELED